MLSRLLKSKGVVEYLKASSKVKQVFPDTRFVLLGNYDSTMQDSIAKEYIEGYVLDGIIERYQETDDVRPFYAQCSVYVLPSYREGMPRTVLEAMATGRPIITTNTNGCRETIIDGESGFLIPVGDPDTLAERMMYFIRNKSEIVRMGKNARNLCKEKFDVEIVNSEMIRIMDVNIQ